MRAFRVLIRTVFTCALILKGIGFFIAFGGQKSDNMELAYVGLYFIGGGVGLLLMQVVLTKWYNALQNRQKKKVKRK